MFRFFKKNKETKIKKDFSSLDSKLTALILAYEVARSDGEVSDNELEIIFREISKISKDVNKTSDEIYKILEMFSKNSVSFHEFIEDINKHYSIDKKLEMLSYLWEIAYADNVLEVDEEKLIRRIADLIHIKDIKVLNLKDKYKNSI